MGAAASTADANSAYHVLQVSPNSPGEQAGLNSFFDFITAANGQVLNKDDASFVEILTSNVNNPVKLQVFNALSNASREVIMTPNRDWGGAGLAGINVRMSNINKALTLVWHVVQVYENGPASAAGLESVNDFIVGVPGLLFFDPDDFYNLVKVNLNKALSLYVYSTRTRSIRIASVTPDPNWGGNGFLGCEVAYGLNHQLVSSLSDSPPPQSNSPVGEKVVASVLSSPKPAPAVTHDHASNSSHSSPKLHSHHHDNQEHRHKHGPNCKHGHSHDHDHAKSPKTTAQKHSHHHHAHDGPCDHDHHHHDHDHKHDNHKIKHSSHSHSSTQANAAPQTPSKETSSHSPIASTPGPSTVPFHYTPSQLFSPLQKLPQDYHATPLPEELFDDEDIVPFQSRFGN